MAICQVWEGSVCTWLEPCANPLIWQVGVLSLEESPEHYEKKTFKIICKKSRRGVQA